MLLGAAGYGVSTLGQEDLGGLPGTVTDPGSTATDGSGGASDDPEGGGSEDSGQDSGQDSGEGSGDGQSGGAGAQAADVPEGWQTTEGEAGWTAAVPASWRATDYPLGMQFRDPQTGRTLRVTTGPGSDEAVQDRKDQARDFARRHPDYQEVRIEQVDYRGYPAADWEFTYSDGGADLHVVNRVFNVDGTGHSLFFQVRASDWPAAREDFEQIVATFRPAGA